MSTRSALALFFCLAVAAGAATAQEAKKPDAKKDQPRPAMQMHQDMVKGSRQSMAMKPSGDMDRDFARMMRHHHVMGVKMAEYEIRHGKDPKVKELAQKIADSQKEEIKQFDEWLKSRRAGK